MDILEIMKARHSVRQYRGKKIEDEKRQALSALIDECSRESGLNLQILFDEPKCFDSIIALGYGEVQGTAHKNKPAASNPGNDEDGKLFRSQGGRHYGKNTPFAPCEDKKTAVKSDSLVSRQFFPYFSSTMISGD